MHFPVFVVFSFLKYVDLKLKFKKEPKIDHFAKLIITPEIRMGE
jgi:hypothetical protein